MLGIEKPDPEAPTADRPAVFRLRPDSAAIDVGAEGDYHHVTESAAPDAGALELGEEWVIPRPGPRWAVGDLTPWRPPLPPSGGDSGILHRF